MSRRGRPPLPWEMVAVSIIKPTLRAFVRRDWRRQDKIPGQGGVIVAANHLSWADPLLLAHYVYNSGRWPVFLAKAPIFKVKVIGPIVRRLRQIPVYRHRTDAALALKDAEQGLRQGACIIVYPEGTCTRDPDLWPMVAKTGVARLALATGAPVVPVAHWGAQEVLPYHAKKPRLFPRKTFHVVAGDPVDLSGYAGRPLNAETLRAATAEVMAAITALLAELRGAVPPERPYDPRSGGPGGPGGPGGTADAAERPGQAAAP